jgi:gamma-glutamyltranspeptidase/glutathione hydrolase
MGGYMQPQGHVQVVMNMIDFHLNPQSALDAPRWQWMEGKKFIVEHNFDPAIVKQLVDKGHQVEMTHNSVLFGRGQIIVRLDNGTLVGGCEARTDSNIACY